MAELDFSEIDRELLTWLSTLDAESLATVLANRPDALDAPWPRRLADLAARLGAVDSVVFALRGLPAPDHQVLAAIEIRAELDDGRSANADDVAGLLGTTVGAITPIVARLAEHALLWPDKAGRITLAAEELPAAGVRQDLGEPLARLLPTHTAAQLKQIAEAIGVSTQGRKQELADRLLAFYRDGARVRELAATAPAEARELLDRLAWHGPEIDVEPEDHYFFSGGGHPAGPVAWARRHGLLWAVGFGQVHLPLEAGLALRGADYRLPFTPAPPRLRTAQAPGDQVAVESATAALHLLDRTVAVVAATASKPLPLLKSGRVGIQGIRALAKQAGTEPELTRLVVELAIRLGLLAPVEPEPEPAPRSRGRKPARPAPLPPVGLAPTAVFATWRESGATAMLAGLLDAWWNLPITPLADEKALLPILGSQGSAAFAHTRQTGIRLIAELPADVGVVDGLAELLCWRIPMLTPRLADQLLPPTLAEATLLGVVAGGAAGPLARAMVAATGEDGLDTPIGDAPGLVAAIDGLRAGARTSALFGADLTAVVTGPPDAGLAALLDVAADREAQGTASTWRFGPASVRRALDAGETAAGLLDRLAAVAQRELPQPLVYLINDAARRHGEVVVRDAGCVLVVEAAGLLAEIRAHRGLATLGLVQVAPTVLVSAADARTTLSALRAAGYAPAHHDADGSPVPRVERMAPAPAVAEPDGQQIVMLGDQVMVLPADFPEFGPLPRQDPREHAERLLATAGQPNPRRGAGALSRLARRSGGRSTLAELAWRLEAGLPVRVEYTEPGADPRQLVISTPEPVDADRIECWVEPDGRYERLDVNRIQPAQR